MEDSDYAHPGVRLMENSRGGLENCTVRRNGYGVAVDNNAQARAGVRGGVGVGVLEYGNGPRARGILPIGVMAGRAATWVTEGAA